MSYKDEFIEFMVRSKVLTFGDFITKSGRKTPYFINTGNYKTGQQAALLGKFYAQCIQQNIKGKIDLLFGPAYKGIPLAVSTAMALYSNHGVDVGYAFNRKEAKDHGEGGNLIGATPKSGDHVLIIEDVMTAGTSIRESVPLLQTFGNISIDGIIISVDRMEKGQNNKSAMAEIYETYGIVTYPIVNVRDIINRLHNKPVDGIIYIDDEKKRQMEEYLDRYGV